MASAEKGAALAATAEPDADFFKTLPAMSSDIVGVTEKEWFRKVFNSTNKIIAVIIGKHPTDVITAQDVENYEGDRQAIAVLGRLKLVANRINKGFPQIAPEGRA